MDFYSDFAKGTTGVRPLQSFDIAVRQPESFAAMKDLIANRDSHACSAYWPGAGHPAFLRVLNCYLPRRLESHVVAMKFF